MFLRTGLTLFTFGALGFAAFASASAYDTLIEQGHPALFLKTGGPLAGVAKAYPATKPLK